VATQADLIYHPPGVIGLIQATVDKIAERESRDVVRNIQVLDEIASTPAPRASARTDRVGIPNVRYSPKAR
jgi:hypothetical protein